MKPVWIVNWLDAGNRLYIKPYKREGNAEKKRKTMQSLGFTAWITSGPDLTAFEESLNNPDCIKEEL